MIKLTKGKSAIVDRTDFARVSLHKWHYTNSGYAFTRIYKAGKSIGYVGMHRLIMSAEKGIEVDHVNGNKLDNRRENLRLCERKHNCFNRSREKRSPYMYKGVCWRKRVGRWSAQISMNNKQKFLGYHDTQEQAARAYDDAARQLYGEFAKVNFK